MIKDNFTANLCSESCELRIKETDSAGRGLFVLDEAQKNQVVYKEAPFVIGPPITEVDKIICISCAAPIQCWDTFCQTCFIGMCKNCSHFSKEECHLFAALTQPQKLRRVSNWIAVLRVILNEGKSTISWKDLEDHSDKNQRIKFYKDTFVNSIKEIYPTTKEEKIIRIAAILDSNSFRINKHGLRGLFGLSSFINHDCNPNARVLFDSRGHLHLLAKRKIQPGEEIRISYVAPLLSTQERRERLMTSKFFHCKCERCNDPTEFGSHLGSLLCSKCKSGYVLKSSSSSWKCIECDFTASDEKVKQFLKTIHQKLTNSSSNMEALQKTLKIMESRLPQSHSIMLEFKKQLLELAKKSASPGSIELKLNILNERLDILKILEGDTDSHLKGFLCFQILELHMGQIYLSTKNAKLQDSTKLVEALKDRISMNIEIAQRILKDDNNCPPDLLRLSSV